MSSRTIVDQIRHYQKDIERCPDNAERMIRCIQRLYVLPVSVQHLQETGVGRSVNALRKYNGEVGDAAKALVTKWKAMVAAEESDDGGPPPAKELYDNSKKPPSSQAKTENGTALTVEKLGKQESARHSSHKRSHSTSDKVEKKSSSSSDRDKKSDSGKAGKNKHDSRHSKERAREERHSKKSKENLKSKETTEDDSDQSPSRKKRKKNCVKERRKQQLQESEDSSAEGSASEGSDHAQKSSSDEGDDTDSNHFEDDPNDSGDEVSAACDKGSSSEESSSDRKRHNERKRSSSEHHKSKSSSHGSSSKPSHHKEGKHDHKKASSSNSTSDLDKLIKENEKQVKKEKFESAYDSGGSTPKGLSSPRKHKEKPIIVKAETNDDGSIDAGSGFSFGDALAGLDSVPKKKKKSVKEEPSKSSSSSTRHNSSSSNSHKSSKSSSSSSSKDHSSSSSSKKHSSSSSSKKEKHSDTSMPDLLKKPIKMENLELDINSTLPEINPNYRPLPHVPENLRRNSTKTATNEEEMFSMMMNKNQRTKVFSGGKHSYNQQVPSLYELCIKLLYDNIDGLEYTGGVPYDLLKPLLEKLNPDQLFVLEHYNPYLIEDTGSLWEFHCKKDFRNHKRQDMESWRDLYIRCMEEREEKLKALTQNISQSIAASTPVRKAKLAYVDSAVKPPRNIARKQAKYGTGDSSPIMKAHAAEKQKILNKAVVGAHDPSNAATTTVPPPPPSSAPRSSWSAPVAVAPNKKRKAPLMAKALQLIKGASRFKR